MRKGDYCIRNIDKLVEEGCISLERARDLKKWQAFRIEHPEISGLTEGACKPLMREADPEVQAKAIEKIENALNLKKPVTAAQSTRVVKNLEEGKETRGRPLGISNDIERTEPVIRETNVDEDIDADVETVVEDFVDPDNDDVCGILDIPDMPAQPIIEVVDTNEGTHSEEVVEEEEKDIDKELIHPEITPKLSKEFLTNAGHQDAPRRSDIKLLPTEEAKQAIFDKCTKQAFEWGMDGDEIARRMEKAIIYIHSTGIGVEN